jgi:hypothetical protein
MIGRSAEGERNQVLTADLAEEFRHVAEHDVDVAGHHVLDRRRAAAIGDVQQVDASQLLEQLAGEVLRGAVAGRGVAQLAGILFREVDDIGDAAQSDVLADDQHVVDAGDVADRHEILVDVDRQLLARHHRRNAERGHGGEQDALAVGRRLGHRLVGDEAAGAGLGLDDHLLADDRPGRIGQQATQQIGGTAGRKATEDAHIALDLRACRPPNGRRRRGACSAGDHCPSQHHTLPLFHF